MMAFGWQSRYDSQRDREGVGIDGVRTVPSTATPLRNYCLPLVNVCVNYCISQNFLLFQFLLCDHQHDSLPFSDGIDTSGSNENEEDLQQNIDMMNYLIDELSRRERELGELGEVHEVQRKVRKRAKKQKTSKTGNNSATSGPTPVTTFVDIYTIPDELDRCLLDALPKRRRKRTKRTKEAKTTKATKRARRQLADAIQQAEAQGFDYTATDELESLIQNFNGGDIQASFDEDYEDEDDDDNYDDDDSEIEDLLYDDEEEEEFLTEEDFSSVFRNLQVDPADYDRAAVRNLISTGVFQCHCDKKRVIANPQTNQRRIC